MLAVPSCLMLSVARNSCHRGGRERCNAHTDTGADNPLRYVFLF